jgi:hypothetical protein
VPGRVDVLDRIVSDVAVTIERLRIARRRNDRIGRNKPRQVGIIVSGAIVVETELRIKNLAGEPPVGLKIRPLTARYFSPLPGVEKLLTSGGLFLKSKI